MELAKESNSSASINLMEIIVVLPEISIAHCQAVGIESVFKRTYG